MSWPGPSARLGAERAGRRHHRPAAAPRLHPPARGLDTLDPRKDIDGIHPLNAGLLALGYDGYLPATAHASVELLKRSGIELAGKHAVVVGRSNVIGKPAALLLLREHATVTTCHSRTPRSGRRSLREADIVVVAVGRPRPRSPARCSSPGAVVVDVGINVVDGSASWATSTSSRPRRWPRPSRPCPAASGPLTNAILLTHLMRAARDQATRQVAVGAPLRSAPASRSLPGDHTR